MISASQLRVKTDSESESDLKTRRAARRLIPGGESAGQEANGLPVVVLRVWPTRKFTHIPFNGSL